MDLHTRIQQTEPIIIAEVTRTKVLAICVRNSNILLYYNCTHFSYVRISLQNKF